MSTYEPINNVPHLVTLERLVDVYRAAKVSGMPQRTLDAIAQAATDSTAAFKLAYIITCESK